MNAQKLKTGTLPGGLAFARFGTGERRLVIFPGLADAVWDVASGMWNLGEQYERFAQEFTISVISRKRRLPSGYTTRDMAGDYSAAFEQEIGPAVVMGISLGSYVAQHFAADHPQYVTKLVIACGAHRISETGREIPRRWLALARQNRWREFYFDIARVTRREFQQPFYEFLISLVGRKKRKPDDFLVSLEACLAHDGSETLQRIAAPTFVVGGTEDVYFPPSLLRETARRIRDATLHLIQGGGHGAYELQRDEFQNRVLDFLHNHDTAQQPQNALLAA